MKNKKIKNATKSSFSGISFKSKLEATIYKTLKENGITPAYEEKTFKFLPTIRPTIPFFNRVNKVFTLDMKPLRPITYTPDFTFMYQDILVIIEVKGFENDVYPMKRNLFRRFLEKETSPIMYFEVRTKKETLQALKIIKMESPQVRRTRRLIPFLPEKDIPIGNKLLEARDWKELHSLVSSAIIKVERAIAQGNHKYDGIDLEALYSLQLVILESL